MFYDSAKHMIERSECPEVGEKDRNLPRDRIDRFQKGEGKHFQGNGRILLSPDEPADSVTTPPTGARHCTEIHLGIHPPLEMLCIPARGENRQYGSCGQADPGMSQSRGQAAGSAKEQAQEGLQIRSKSTKHLEETGVQIWQPWSR